MFMGVFYMKPYLQKLKINLSNAKRNMPKANSVEILIQDISPQAVVRQCNIKKIHQEKQSQRKAEDCGRAACAR